MQGFAVPGGLPGDLSPFGLRFNYAVPAGTVAFAASIGFPVAATTIALVTAEPSSAVALAGAASNARGCYPPAPGGAPGTPRASSVYWVYAAFVTSLVTSLVAPDATAQHAALAHTAAALSQPDAALALATTTIVAAAVSAAAVSVTATAVSAAAVSVAAAALAVVAATLALAGAALALAAAALAVVAALIAAHSVLR